MIHVHFTLHSIIIRLDNQYSERIYIDPFIFLTNFNI